MPLTGKRGSSVSRPEKRAQEKKSSGHEPTEGLSDASTVVRSVRAKKCASTDARAARSLFQSSIVPVRLSPALVEPTINVGGGFGASVSGARGVAPQISAAKSGRPDGGSTGAVGS